MADSNQHKRADVSEFTDNDPFAELTRIMGHDPRAAKPAPSSDADDFDIDLEKELMGDFAEFDEVPATAPETAHSWREASGQAEDAETAFSPESRFGDAGEAEGYARQDDEAYQPPVEAPAPSDGLDDDLDAAFADTFGEEIEAEDAPVSEQEGQEGDVSEYREAAQDAWSPYEPAEYEPAAPEAAAPAETPPAFDDGMAEVDMDFSLLEEDLILDDEPAAVEFADDARDETEAVAEDEPVASVVDAGEPYLAAAEPEPAAYENADREDLEGRPVAYAAPAESSLEDELSALLSDDEPAAAEADDWQDRADQDGSFSPAEPEAEWQPVVSTFGHAHTPDEWQEPEDQEADEAPVHEEPVAVEAAHDPAESSGLGDDEIADIFSEHLAAETGVSPEAAPKAYDPFAALSALGRSITPERSPEFRPEAAAVEPLRPWRPELQDSLPEPAFRPLDSDEDDIPDVETIEIADGAQAVADDLDIPEIDYEAAVPTANAYDDLEGEFGDAFNDFAAKGVEQPAAPANSASADHGWSQPSDAAAAAATAAAQPDPYAAGEGHWQPEELQDCDNDLERAIAMASYEDETPVQSQPPARRGLLVAAIVAGVAIVGGAGVFAMSLFGDGGSDVPAVVLADDDPMKIRPENPGGTTVPNQDSEAYRRVSGVEADPGPEQERLITTAEEPLDVAARSEPEAPAPGVSLGDDPEPEIAAAQPKSEDRIEPVTEEPGIGANDDLLAVTPRKVRTMIVRPDGTMVPREDPEPAAETQVAQPEGQQLLAAAPAASALPGVDSPILAPAGSEVQANEDAGPRVDTPATVGVVPSQRAAPQVAAAPVRAEPAPAAQQPAATPVSAPATTPTAAGSEWSMQIASQPTAEGAQATYQDLARRYGGVLQGRGVNIVRADIAGKGIYYRVRIPTANRDEAIQLCTQYKSAGGSCFVSR